MCWRKPTEEWKLGYVKLTIKYGSSSMMVCSCIGVEEVAKKWTLKRNSDFTKIVIANNEKNCRYTKTCH